MELSFLEKAALLLITQPMLFGVSIMLPISQNLNNGKVEIKNRLSVYVNINI